MSYTITLPDEKAMMDILLSVRNERHLQDYLYPLLVEYAGIEMAATDLAITLKTAAEAYLKMTDSIDSDLPSMIINIFIMEIGRYIDALSGGNEEFAQLAKERFQWFKKRSERLVG